MLSLTWGGLLLRNGLESGLVTKKSLQRMSDLAIACGVGGIVLCLAMWANVPLQPTINRSDPISRDLGHGNQHAPPVANDFAQDALHARSLDESPLASSTISRGEETVPDEAEQLSTTQLLLMKRLDQNEPEDDLLLAEALPQSLKEATDRADSFTEDLSAKKTLQSPAPPVDLTPPPQAANTDRRTTSVNQPEPPSLHDIAMGLYQFLRDCDAPDARSVRLAVEAADRVPATKYHQQTAVLQINYPDENRLVAIEHFRGIPWGHVALFHPGQQPMLLGRFEEGRLDGIITAVSPEGEPFFIQHYAKGRRHGTTCWLDHGMPQLIIEFENDEAESAFLYEDGVLQEFALKLDSTESSLSPILEQAITQSTDSLAPIAEAFLLIRQTLRDYEKNCRKMLAITNQGANALPTHKMVELPFHQESKLIEVIEQASQLKEQAKTE